MPNGVERESGGEQESDRDAANDVDGTTPEGGRPYPLEEDPVLRSVDRGLLDDPGITLLRGFMQGPVDGLWRLYLSLDLGEYLLLKDEDVAHQYQVGLGSLVWVRSDRSVRHVRVRTAEELDAEFLQGEIEARRTDRSAPASMAGPPERASAPALGPPASPLDPWDDPQSLRRSRPGCPCG